MSAPLRGAFKSLINVNKAVLQQRATVISGPPKNKISTPELVGLGTLLIGAVCAPAAYIMANITNYRGLTKSE